MKNQFRMQYRLIKLLSNHAHFPSAAQWFRGISVYLKSWRLDRKALAMEQFLGVLRMMMT